MFDIVAAATYLVVGLGDVYLGAPGCRTARPAARARHHEVQPGPDLDAAERCRHRRDLPVRLRNGRARRLSTRRPHGSRSGGCRSDEQPWLLRQFDRIRFTPVSPTELAQAASRDQDRPRGSADVRPATFSIADVRRIEQEAPMDIVTLRAIGRAAFDAERARWGA